MKELRTTVKILIGFSLFNFLILVFEDYSRLGMQDYIYQQNNRIEESRYLLAEETRLYFVNKEEIMPSCLKGERTKS